VGENGTLRWVASEAVAIALYGSTWNTQIDDVPDGFFTNYQAGSNIEDVSDFIPTSETAAATSIDNDKGLKSPYIVRITDSGYSETDLVMDAGRAVKFTNTGSSKHTATAEDLSWGSGTLNAGDSFIRYFNEEGEFDFFCSYHSSEIGTITVD
jgi:plastocyanin